MTVVRRLQGNHLVTTWIPDELATDEERRLIDNASELRELRSATSALRQALYGMVVRGERAQERSRGRRR